MPSDADRTVNYRWLDGPTATDEDWQRIEDIQAERGWPSLNHETTRIRVAEDDEGKLLGYLVLQLFPHLEPLYVVKEARGTGIAEQLADDMFAFMTEIKCRGWMAIADSPHAKELCEKKGMTRVKSPVYIVK